MKELLIKNSKVTRLALRALPILFLAVWAGYFISLNFYGDIPIGNDDTEYLLIAKAFTLGRGYEDISKPIRQNTLLVPSGFPFLLTLYWKFLHPHTTMLKLFLAGLLTYGAWASHLLLKRFVSPLEAFLTALAFSSTTFFVYLGSSTLSETLFIPLFYTGCLFTIKESEPDSRRAYGWAALACWVLLSRVRALGLPFFLVYVFLLAMRREWKKVIIGTCVLAVWIAAERLAKVPGAQARQYLGFLYKNYPLFSGDFLRSLSVLAKNTTHNAWSFAGSIYACILFPWFYHMVLMNPFKRLVVLFLFGINCWGAGILWKEKHAVRPLIIALVIYWIPVLCWPRTGTIFRYAFPVFPLFILFALLPVRRALRNSNPDLTKSVSAVLLIVVILNQAVYSSNKSYENPYIPDRDGFKDLHGLIASAQTKPDIILSPQNYYTYLKTEIHSFNRYPNTEGFCDYIAGHPGKEAWMILNTKESPAPGPVVCGSPTLDRDPVPVFTKGIWAAYRIVEREAVNDTTALHPPGT